MARMVKQDRQLKEKLMEVLEGWLTQAELEIDSEAEEMGEAEESEVVGTEEPGTMGGTQSSAMEVDEEEEDKVVVVEEVKQGEARKWAPSSLPKTSRKRVHMATAMQPSVGSQGPESSVQGRPCWRCVKHQTQCVMVSGMGQCENC